MTTCFFLQMRKKVTQWLICGFTAVKHQRLDLNTGLPSDAELSLPTSLSCHLGNYEAQCGWGAEAYPSSPHRSSSLTFLDPPVACPRFWDPRFLSHPFPGQWCMECLCPRPVTANKDVQWNMQKKILINLLEIPVWGILLHCQWIKCFTSSKRACLVLALLSMYTTPPLPPAQHRGIFMVLK